MLPGVRHLVALALLFDNPVQQRIDLGKVLLRQVGFIPVHVLEVRLLGERRLVQVIIGGKSVVVSDLRQFFHVILVDVRDVDVDHHRITVAALVLHQIIEIGLNPVHRLGQPRLFIDAIDGEVPNGDTRIADAIDHFRAHQTAVRGQVDEEILFGGVVCDFVNVVGPQERLAAHQRQDAASDPMYYLIERRPVSSLMPFTLLLNDQQ